MCLLLMLAVTGCVTHHWVAKEVAGLVVDADTRVPLAGVAIYRSIHSERTFVGKTDDEGRFHIPAKGVLRFEVPLGDPMHASSLEFVLSGYLESSVGCGTITGDVVSSKPPVLEAAVVEMKKRPNQTSEPTSGLTPGRGSL